MASVLVVDDSDFIRDTIKNILIKSGHIVIGEASNFNDAYSIYANLTPDLITLDLVMSDSEDLSFINKLLSDFPDAKIIVISAIANKTIIFEALEIGVKSYIVKPFSDFEVLNVINQVLI